VIKKSSNLAAETIRSGDVLCVPFRSLTERFQLGVLGDVSFPLRQSRAIMSARNSDRFVAR